MTINELEASFSDFKKGGSLICFWVMNMENLTKGITSI
jgi:hypothetical protein